MTLADLQTQWRAADHPELAASPAFQDRADPPSSQEPEAVWPLNDSVDGYTDLSGEYD